MENGTQGGINDNSTLSIKLYFDLLAAITPYALHPFRPKIVNYSRPGSYPCL